MVRERERTRRTIAIVIGSLIAVAITAGVYVFSRYEGSAASEAPVSSTDDTAAAGAASAITRPPRARPSTPTEAVIKAAAAPLKPPKPPEDALAGVTPPTLSDAEAQRDEDYASQVGDTRPVGDQSNTGGNSTD